MCAVNSSEIRRIEVVIVFSNRVPTGSEFTELRVIIIAILLKEAGVEALRNTVLVKLIVLAVEFNDACCRSAVDIVLVADPALSRKAVNIVFTVGEFAGKCFAAIGAKHLRQYDLVLRLAEIIGAGICHRGAGPCNRTVRTVKPVIEVGNVISCVGKEDGVGLDVFGIVCTDRLFTVVVAGDINTFCAGKVDVNGLPTAAVDDVLKASDSRSMVVTGSGNNSTPVNYGVTLVAEGSAAVACLGAGSGLVCDRVSVVLMPGGYVDGAVLVALIDADVAIFTHSLGITLDCRRGEVTFSAVRESDTACLGEYLGIHRIDAFLCDDDPVRILSESIVRIPCADRDRSDNCFACQIDGSEAVNGYVNKTLIKVADLSRCGKAVSCLDTLDLPIVDVIDFECCGYRINFRYIGSYDIDVIQRAD